MLNQEPDPELFNVFARLTQDEADRLGVVRFDVEEAARDYYEGFLEAIKQAAFETVDQWQDARESLPPFSNPTGDVPPLSELVGRMV